MKIGIPREIKVRESRVACSPGGVRMFADAGHEVLVEKNAGVESGFDDEQYLEAGAHVVPSAEDAWSADMVSR